MITTEAIEAAALSDATFDGRRFDGLSSADKRRYRERAAASIAAALAAMPAPAARGTVAAFEDAYPELYYHIAKGKICAGEPLYGAIITTMGTTEIGHGESDISADDAFQSAVKSAGLYIQPAPGLAAENERLRAALKKITQRVGGTVCQGQGMEMTRQRVKYLEDDIRDIARAALERT